MANYAADYTSRLLVDYTGPLFTHHMLFRFGTVNDPASLVTRWNNLASLFLALLENNCNVDEVKYAPVGSSFFLPLGGATVGAGTNALGYDITINAEGFFTSFEFVSTAGSRYANYFFFTPSRYNAECKFQYTALPAVYSDFASAIVSQGCTAIDRNSLVARSYVTTGINDEITHKARR